MPARWIDPRDKRPSEEFVCTICGRKTWREMAMYIATQDHVFKAETPAQLSRLLHLLAIGSMRLAVFFYGVALR